MQQCKDIFDLQLLLESSKEKDFFEFFGPQKEFNNFKTISDNHGYVCTKSEIADMKGNCTFCSSHDGRMPSRLKPSDGDMNMHHGNSNIKTKR